MSMNPKDIVRSPFQLRPVRKQTLDYVCLRNSIKNQGILQPILIRKTHRGWEIIDGAHRHECALDLNIDDVPVHIVDMTDEEVLEAQVSANVQRVRTLDADLARRLWRITKKLDHKVVANRMGKSLSWVKMVCQMERLTPMSLELYEDGKISFRHAVLLARIPRSNQEQCWGLDIAQLRHVIRQLKTQGRTNTEVGLTPMYRPIIHVINEADNPTEAGRIILNETDSSPVQVWKAALRWATQMDRDTKARREKKFAERDDQPDPSADTIL